MSEVDATTAPSPSSELKKAGVANGSTAHEPAVELPTNGHHDDEDADDGEESDDYDPEEEQQAVEGEDDEYVDLGDDEENEGGHQQTNGKSNLTALLLGDPNVGEDEEEQDDQYDDDAEDADEDYEADGNDEEEDEYVEPETPTTSKKRSLDEALEEAASPREENQSKKVKGA